MAGFQLTIFIKQVVGQIWEPFAKLSTKYKTFVAPTGHRGGRPPGNQKIQGYYVRSMYSTEEVH